MNGGAGTVTNFTDKEGDGIIWQVYMGICEPQAHKHTVQSMPQDSSEDLKIREHQQRHGEKGFQAGRAYCNSLIHASRWPHQWPLDHLS